MLCNMTVIIPSESHLGSKALSCSPSSPGFPHSLRLAFECLRLPLKLYFPSSTIDFVFSLGMTRGETFVDEAFTVLEGPGSITDVGKSRSSGRIQVRERTMPSVKTLRRFLPSFHTASKLNANMSSIHLHLRPCAKLKLIQLCCSVKLISHPSSA